MQEWKELIAVARRKEKVEVTNLEERIQKADDKFKELGFNDQVFLALLEKLVYLPRMSVRTNL